MKATTTLIVVGDETAAGDFMEIEEGGFFTTNLYSADGKQQLALVGEAQHLYRALRIMVEGLDVYIRDYIRDED